MSRQPSGQVGSGACRRSIRPSPPSPTASSARPPSAGPRSWGPATRTSGSSGCATSTSRSATARSRARSDAEDLGFAVRVIHRGRLGVRLRGGADHRRGAAGRRDRGRGGRGGRRDDQHAGRDRARAGVRRRHLGLVVRRQPARRADRREGRAARRLDRPAAAGRGGRPRVGVGRAGAGEQVLRRPGRHDDHPAADPGRPGVRGDGRRRRHLRLDGEHRAAGRPRLGVPHHRPLRLGRPSSTRCPSCSPRSSRRRASRPAATTWSSTRRTCG